MKASKKIWSLFLALVMVVSLMSGAFVVSAADDVVTITPTAMVALEVDESGRPAKHREITMTATGVMDEFSAYFDPNSCRFFYILWFEDGGTFSFNERICAFQQFNNADEFVFEAGKVYNIDDGVYSEFYGKNTTWSGLTITLDDGNTLTINVKSDKDNILKVFPRNTPLTDFPGAVVVGAAPAEETPAGEDTTVPAASFALEADSGLKNFQAINAYTDGLFTDVKAGAWYTEGIKNAYELGLVKGTGETTFDPNGELTIVQTVTLACRIHSIYHTGKADFEASTPWYQVYMDYAVENGIIERDAFSDINAPATRAQFASILSRSLDDAALGEINVVDNGMIPDVSIDSADAAAIYRLYRAGIVIGNDAVGTFTPDSRIQRSAVATIVTRMALPAMRQKITLAENKATSITLSTSARSLSVLEKYRLKATVTPADAEDASVTWETSNSDVVTVEDGVVRAVGVGEATITCTAKSGASAQCTISVYPAVSSVSLPATATVRVGETITLKATVDPDNALDQILWYSNSCSNASVDANGVVTGVSALLLKGEPLPAAVIITACTLNGKSASCTVTVVP